MRLTTRIFAAMVAAFCISSPAVLAVDDSQMDLVDRIFQSASLCWWKPTIVEKLMVFKLPKACWDKMLQPSGFGTVRAVSENLGKYIKRQGYGDFAAQEKALKNKEDGKDAVTKFVEPVKEKLTVTVESKAGRCGDMEIALLKLYLFRLSQFLAKEKWTPPAGAAHFYLILDESAKDITVKTEDGDKQFVITVPADKEVPQWEQKLLSPIRAAGKKAPASSK